ncbi:MAG: filamentous hemagglutinin N-terminal domain-containing protein [Pseudomonadota bacterium]
MAPQPHHHRMARLGQPRRVRPGILRYHYMATTALVALAATPPMLPGMMREAKAGPQGGIVIGGQADIAQQGKQTTINQSSNRAIIEWDNFDIAPDEGVVFRQPSRSSIALNRVNSVDRTTIEGNLSANGQVWIVNPKGVHISRGASVDVGGLLATSADIDNDAFMQGGTDFTIPGDPNAVIQNEGRITFGEAGLVGLVGPNAANDGVIQGRLGKVVVAGTETFAVDMAGDGILALPIGQGTAVSASNSGQILNEGGTVLMDAAAAESLLEASIVAGGEIEARSISVSEGRITLRSTDTVEVTGDIDVSGSGTADGGEITITADERVAVREGAVIDASGGVDGDGGDIRIGGDLRGQGPVPNARITVVEDMATVRVDGAAGGGAGDGGTVVFWGDDVASFMGDVSATGGPAGGDGGFVEISGGFFQLGGTVALDADFGTAGTLLLDPTDIVIEDGGTATPIDNIYAADPGPTSIDADFINNASGSLILEATSGVFFNETVNATGPLDLTVRAATITVNQAITVDGTIALYGADPTVSSVPDAPGVYINADITATGDITIDAALYAGDPYSIDIADGVTISSDGTLSLTAARYVFTNGIVNLETNDTFATPNFVLNGDGVTDPAILISGSPSSTGFSVTQQPGTYIRDGSYGVYYTPVPGRIEISGATSVTLDNAQNAFSEFSVEAADSVYLRHYSSNTANGFLRLDRATVGAGGLDVESTGTVSLPNTAAATPDYTPGVNAAGDVRIAGTLLFTDSSYIVDEGAVIYSGGTVSLEVSTFVPGENTSLDASGDLILPATVASNALFITSRDGDITQSPLTSIEAENNEGFIPFDLYAYAPNGDIVLDGAGNNFSEITIGDAESAVINHTTLGSGDPLGQLRVYELNTSDGAGNSSITTDGYLVVPLAGVGSDFPETFQPQIDVAGNLYVNASSFEVSGGAEVEVDGELTFSAGQQLYLGTDGRVQSGGDLVLPETLIDTRAIIVSTGGGISQVLGTTINGTSPTNAGQPVLSAAGDIALGASGNGFSVVTVEAGNNVTIEGGSPYDGSLLVSGIYASGDVDITAPVLLVDGRYTDLIGAPNDFANTVIYGGGDVRLTGNSLLIGPGYGAAPGSAPVTIEAGSTVNLGSNIGLLTIYDGTTVISPDGFTFNDSILAGSLTVEVANGDIDQAGITTIERYYDYALEGNAYTTLNLSAPNGQVSLTNAGNTFDTISITESQSFDIVHDSMVYVGEANALDVEFLNASDAAASSSITSDLPIEFEFVDAGPPDPDALQPQVDVAGDLYVGSPGASVDIDIVVGGTLSFAGGSTLTMYSDASITTGDTLALPNTEIEGFAFFVSTGGDIVQQGGTTITPYDPQYGYYTSAFIGQAAGTIQLENTGNEIDTIAAIADSVSITVEASQAFDGVLSVAGLEVTNDITITATAIVVNERYAALFAPYATPGAATVQAGGDITLAAQDVLIGAEPGGPNAGTPIEVSAGGLLDIEVEADTLYLYDGTILTSGAGFEFPETYIDGTTTVRVSGGAVTQEAGTQIRQNTEGDLGYSGLRFEVGTEDVTLVDVDNNFSRIDVISAGTVSIEGTLAGSGRTSFEVGAANTSGDLRVVNAGEILLDDVDDTGTAVASTVGGNLEIISSTAITADTALDLTVVGDTTLTAFLLTSYGDTPGTINIDAANLDLQGTVSVLSGDVLLSTGSAGLTVENSTVVGDATIATTLADGDLDVDGLFVTGDATLTAADGDVTVSDATFGGDEFVGGTGTNAVISSLVDTGTVTIDNVVADNLQIGSYGAGTFYVSNSSFVTLTSGLSSGGVALETVTVRDQLTLPTTLTAFEARSLGLFGADLTITGVDPAAGPVVIDDVGGGGSIFITANYVEIGAVVAPVLQVTAAGDVRHVADADLVSPLGSSTEVTGARDVLTGDAYAIASAELFTTYTITNAAATYLIEVTTSASFTSTTGGSIDLTGGTAAGVPLENDFQGSLGVYDFATVAIADANDLGITVGGATDITVETGSDLDGGDSDLEASFEHAGLALVQTNGGVATIDVTQTAPGASLQAVVLGLSVTSSGDVVVENTYAGGAGLASGGVSADGNVTVRDSVFEDGFTAFQSYNGDITLERVQAGSDGDEQLFLLPGTGSLFLTDVTANDVVITDAAASGVIGGDVLLDRFSVNNLSLISDVAGTLGLANGEVTGGFGLLSSVGGLSLTAFQLTAGDLTIADGTIAPGGLLTLDGITAPNIDVDVPNLDLGFVSTGSLTADVDGDIATVLDADLSDPSGTDITVEIPVLSGATAAAVTPEPPVTIAREAFTNLVTVTGTTDLDGFGNVSLGGSAIADNDFQGVFGATTFDTVYVTDANGIDLLVNTTQTLIVQANSDGVGDDGLVTGSFTAFYALDIDGDTIDISGAYLSTGYLSAGTITATGDASVSDIAVYGALTVEGGDSASLTDASIAGTGIVVSTAGDVTVERVQATAGGSNAVGGFDVSAGGDVRVVDLDADIVTVGATQAVGGDVTFDRFDVDSLSVVGDVTGTVSLANGQVSEALDFLATLGGLDLTRLDLGDFTLADGTLTPGSILTLDGIRAGDVDISVPELQIGFLETASLTVTVEGDILKVANADLSDPAAASVTVNAAELGPVPLDFLDAGPSDITLDFDAFTALLAVAGDVDATSTGGGVFALPRGVSGGVDFHNDVAGTLGLDGFSTIVFEGAGDIALDIAGATDLAIAGDADSSGTDGLISGTVGFSGTATFVTPNDVVLNGAFGTVQAVADDVALTAIGSDVAVANTRATSLDIVSDGAAPGSGQIAITDTEITDSLSVGSTGGDVGVTLTRVAADGAIAGTALGSFTAEDLQGEALNIGADSVDVDRAEVALLNIDATTGDATDSVELTDAVVTGDVNVVSGVAPVTLERVDSGGAVAVAGTGSVSATDILSVGAQSFAGETLSLARVEGTDFIVDGGSMDTSVSDLTGDSLVFSSDGPGSLQNISVAALDITSPGQLVIGNDIAVAGDATILAGQGDFTNLAIDGTAGFLAGETLSLTEITAATLEIGGDATGAAVGLTGDVTIATADILGDLVVGTAGSIDITNLAVGGQTVLAAGADLSVVTAVVGGYAGVVPGALLIDSAVLGSELDPALVTSALGQGFLTSDPDSTTITLNNLNAQDLDLSATGDITATFVRTEGLLRLETTEGVIGFNEVSGNPRQLIGPTITVPITGAVGPFTVAAPGDVDGVQPVTAATGAAGPNDAGAVDIGITVGALVGDPDDPGIIGATVDPVPGTAGGDPGAGAPDVPGGEDRDVVIVPPDPETPLDEDEEEIVEQILAQDLIDEEQALAVPFFTFEEPAFALPRVDFGALFSASGNENLWTRGFTDDEEETQQ